MACPHDQIEFIDRPHPILTCRRCNLLWEWQRDGLFHQTGRVVKCMGGCTPSSMLYYESPWGLMCAGCYQGFRNWLLETRLREHNPIEIKGEALT